MLHLPSYYAGILAGYSARVALRIKTEPFSLTLAEKREIFDTVSMDSMISFAGFEEGFDHGFSMAPGFVPTAD